LLPIEKPHSFEDKQGVFQAASFRPIQNDIRWKVNVPSPHDLNFIDHLPHSFYADDRFLSKLLQIETRHLTPKEQSPLFELAPEPLVRQMRSMKDSMLGCFGYLLRLG
jgi:hypothetical protein